MVFNSLFTGGYLALSLYIDNNDNKMTFLGNIVYLRPYSAICGHCASRLGRNWHYVGANKQIYLKKSFYSLINKNMYPELQTNQWNISCIDNQCDLSGNKHRAQILASKEKKHPSQAEGRKNPSS